MTIDTAAPTAPAITTFSNDSGTVGDGITNDNTLTLTGTAAANSTVKVYDGATLLGKVTANGSGAWSYTTAALADGTHSLTATATDAAGNTSAASAALNVTIDTAAPSAPAIASFSNDSGTVGDGITNDNTLTLTGTAAANSTVKVYDGATLLGTATANGSGAWSYTTAALADGSHSLTATATDTAGNTSAAFAALNVTVDTVAPLAPTITSRWFDTIDTSTGAHIWKLAGTTEANATVKVYDGSTLLGAVTADGSGAWSFIAGALQQGAHRITATGIDAAGNTSEASGTMHFVEKPVPISLLPTPISPAATTSNDETSPADNTGAPEYASAPGKTRGGFEGIVDLDTDGDDIFFWGDHASMVPKPDGGQPAVSPLLSSASTNWNTAGVGPLNAAGEAEHWWLHDNAILDISQVNAAALASTGVAGGESEILRQHDNGVPDILQLNTENLVSNALVAGASNAGFSVEGRGEVSLQHDNDTDSLWQVNAIQPDSSSAVVVLASNWQTALYHYDLT